MTRASLPRAVLLSLPIACLAAGPALAVDATPERAAAGEAAIRDFMVDMLGPTLRVGDKPIHLQPAGDHYDASAILGPGQPATARVRDAGAGVWTFDTLRYPNPAHFTIELPSAGGTRPPGRLSYDLKAAEQDGAGSIDTTFATPSTTTASFRALDVTSTGANRTSTSHIGRGTGSNVMRAGKAANTVDFLSTSTLADYSIVATAATKDLALNLRLDADTLEGKATMEGVSREKGPALLRAMVATLANDYAALAAGPTAGKPFDTGPARAMLANLSGLSDTFTVDQTASKLRGVVNGFGFSLDKVRMGLDIRSPDGTLGLGMELEGDGIAIPALATNPFAPFIPTKFEIHPTISGVSTQDFLAALQASMDPNRPDDAGPPPEFLALLSKPGLAAEITRMEVDIGSSVITGKGKVGAPVPGQFGGAGQVAVTDFDALTDRVKALPQAGQVLPVLLFAKGIGRTDGPRTVWDITYDAGKLLVNGVDVLAMAGGGGGRPPR